MLSYNLFPAFSGGKSYLVGASAGVMAVLIGVATQAPNMYVRLLIIGNVKFMKKRAEREHKTSRIEQMVEEMLKEEEPKLEKEERDWRN